MAPESQDPSKNSVVMQSALTSHEGELVWSISELSQLKNSSIVSNEFSIVPCCKITWEIQLDLGNDVGATNIKIKRKVLFRESCRATIRCSFENSKGDAYNFMQETFQGNDLISKIPRMLQKDAWNFTKCSHDDVLVVRCQIKLKNCCIVTKTMEKDETCKTSLLGSDLSVNLLKGFEGLYKRKLLTDVEIKVGDKSFPAHKIILCIRSPVFLNMLESHTAKRGTRVIVIGDARPKVIKAFLLFLYTDAIGELSTDDIRELYAVAHKYKVGLLQEKCSSVLLENLDDETACKTLKMADSYNNDALKEAASNYIKAHLSSLEHTREFKSLRENHPSVVLDILLGGLSTTAATSGTAIKFDPPTLRDTMIKGGVQCNILTRCQCITSMEVYKNKSLEEMRVEYYATTLKSGVGSSVEATQQSSLFGRIAAACTPAIQSKPTFGTTFTTSGLTATEPIKFNPPTLRDTMIKGGVACNIFTRCQCITSMEEYKNKSLEEMRVEYYAATLKSGVGSSVEATQQSSLFGGIAAACTPAIQSKPTFGTTFTTNNTPQSSWFNAPSQAHASGGFIPIQGSYSGINN